jgi:hypothetical protein
MSPIFNGILIVGISLFFSIFLQQLMELIFPRLESQHIITISIVGGICGLVLLELFGKDHLIFSGAKLGLYILIIDTIISNYSDLGLKLKALLTGLCLFKLILHAKNIE